MLDERSISDRRNPAGRRAGYDRRSVMIVVSFERRRGADRRSSSERRSGIDRRNAAYSIGQLL